MRFTDPQKWISRKELKILLGVSYAVVKNNESAWGISLLRVRINRRFVVFPREETINQLRDKFPMLKI